MKDEMIQASGVIAKDLGHENYTVRLDNGHECLGRKSGRMHINHIHLMLGDAVDVELSPYDLQKCRIVYRGHRNPRT
jgi:translation initiation factor IF-1